jgi:hypothetical protein
LPAAGKAGTGLNLGNFAIASGAGNTNFPRSTKMVIEIELKS